MYKSSAYITNFNVCMIFTQIDRCSSISHFIGNKEPCILSPKAQHLLPPKPSPDQLQGDKEKEENTILEYFRFLQPCHQGSF